MDVLGIYSALAKSRIATFGWLLVSKGLEEEGVGSFPSDLTVPNLYC